MNLISKVFRKIYARWRVFFYNMLSMAKVQGKAKFVSPVLVEGLGKVSVAAGVEFGFQSDLNFWNSHIFLNPKNADSSISIGENTIVCNNFSAVSEGPGIQIGANVLIGSSVCIYDSDFHEIDPAHRLDGVPKMGKVVIEDNVWIGDRVTILKGSRIGKNSVVAAGAVVSGEFPSNVVIGGVPAKVIREISSKL